MKEYILIMIIWSDGGILRIIHFFFQEKNKYLQALTQKSMRILPKKIFKPIT